MSDVAIRIDGLSKQYHIGSAQQTYDRIGEQIAATVFAPFRRVRKLLRGQATGAAELDETIWALKDVSLEVKQGEVVGIIGRNGAGKSTLLKILSRITEPSTGYADIYGRVGSLLEVGTGFHPELTGRENVFLNGAILGMRKTEIERKFDEIVAFAEIEKFIDTPVKHYSSGMYVRLAFSVAAHLEPEILLVDEVLAVGDIAFQKKCLGKMDDVAHQGRTILFVSHNMALMQTLCQRGIYLQNGSVAVNSSVATAVNAYLAALEQTNTQNLAERTDRQGKGDVRLIGVELEGGVSNPSVLKTGDPARFVFHLNRLLPNTSCLFVFFNSLGQRVAVFESDMAGTEDIYDPNLGSSFICDLPELFLMPGHYHLNVLIRGGGERQDFVEAAAVFDVQQGHVNGRPLQAKQNIISAHMPHRWTVPVHL